jgi:hypothetical protein
MIQLCAFMTSTGAGACTGAPVQALVPAHKKANISAPQCRSANFTPGARSGEEKQHWGMWAWKAIDINHAPS